MAEFDSEVLLRIWNKKINISKIHFRISLKKSIIYAISFNNLSIYHLLFRKVWTFLTLIVFRAPLLRSTPSNYAYVIIRLQQRCPHRLSYSNPLCWKPHGWPGKLVVLVTCRSVYPSCSLYLHLRLFSTRIGELLRWRGHSPLSRAPPHHPVPNRFSFGISHCFPKYNQQFSPSLDWPPPYFCVLTEVEGGYNVWAHCPGRPPLYFLGLHCDCHRSRA